MKSFVIKYPIDIEDNSRPYLGGIKFLFPKGASCWIRLMGDNAKIYKDGVALPSFYEQKFDKETTFDVLDYYSNTSFEIGSRSTKIKEIVGGDVLYYLPDTVTTFNCTGITWKNDLDLERFIKRVPNLKTLELYDDNIKGDLSLFKTYTPKLTWIALQNTAITGDISNLSTLTSLTLVYLSNTKVTGDISSLSSLTKLTHLSIAAPGVTGDITEIVNNLTALKELTITSKITITDEQKATLTNRGCTINIF